LVSLDHLLASIGSAVPPALLEAGFPQLDLEKGHFPPGTEKVDLKVGGKRHLRGVFVPSDPGSPIVIHLLESLGSVTFGSKPLLGYPCLWQLRDMGFSSLMVDYRGVGASSGHRSPRHMRADARSFWMSAIAKVGGNPNRIILRALSLGTLAAACLLEEQVLPKGVVLIAPVRAETVAKNWFKKYHGSTIAFFASLLGRRKPVRVDLQQVIGNAKVPLLAFAPENDYALPPEEMKFVQAAVGRAGGKWVSSPFNHSGHVLQAHSLFPAEQAFLKELFPSLPQVEARLSRASGAIPRPELAPTDEALEGVCSQWLSNPPKLASALALCDAPTQEVLDWLRSIPLERLSVLPAEALAALVHGLAGANLNQLRQLREETEPDDCVPGIPQERIKQAHGFPIRMVGSQWQSWEVGAWRDICLA
jgi:pimeloyl-ACP methyl ester carboxylesterase